MFDVLKVVNWFRVKNNADMIENDNVEELTQMKVMKLLYYVQGISLVYINERFFDEDILAWQYGPVVKKVYDKYHGRRGIVDNISADDIRDYNEINNSKNYADIVNTVYETFGDMSAIDLMKQTHNEKPWKETIQNDIISDELMKEYFKGIVEF